MTDPVLPVLPALRWSSAGGYDLDGSGVVRALEEGVAGFILFGGTAEAARDASAVLRARAGRPLLLGSDLERGVGQQFQGATALPPLAALAADGRLERLYEAGALTGREAVAVGVPWVFAPVADLALEPRNPIVGTRSAGADPAGVAAAVAAWIRGCREAGALACVKHFPGHGRTVEDSHRVLPAVDADRATLEATDLVPFRSALQAGVHSVMTAHVAYPALDPSGRPATRSRAIVHDLLRRELEFDGVVVTDALIMEGAGDPATAAAESLAAGVDLLLYPPPDLPIRRIVREALSAGRLDSGEMIRSRARVEGLLARAEAVRAPSAGSPPPSSPDGEPPREDEGPVGWGSEADRARASRWAAESLRDDRWPFGRPRAVRLEVVDDDLGGPFPPPSRDAFPETLRESGVEVQSGSAGDGGSGSPTAPDAGPLSLLCVYSEPRGWKGRSGLSAEARDRVARWRAGSGGRRGIILFGGPTVQEELPPEVPVLLAWGGEPLMQRAAARRIARVDFTR